MARPRRADQPTAYRVYLRSPGGFWAGRRQRSIVLVGEAALVAQLARKSPIAIWFEPALTHRCQVCRRAGLWDERWVCWPRYKERHDARGDGDDIYCSIDCAKAQNPDLQWPSWMGIDDEPMSKAQKRALWLAQHRDQDAQAAARKAVRGVPMPEWKGSGWCKWCGLEINEKGRSSWHAACVKVYFLHGGALQAQINFLVERDGPACAWPGCRARGCEVDHKVPLWRVAHLPDDQRRPFFGPINLWLICGPHHKAKTALEAADRALARRKARQAAQGEPDLFSGEPKKTLHPDDY